MYRLILFRRYGTHREVFQKMKAYLMTPRVRGERLKQLIGDAVGLNFNDDLVDNYKSQLLGVLIEIAKEKAKKKAHRQKLKEGGFI